MVRLTHTCLGKGCTIGPEKDSEVTGLTALTVSLDDGQQELDQ